MTCFNCTIRVLRVFIHDPIPLVFSMPRHNALRKPLLRMYSGRLAQFQQLRRESTFVTNYDQSKVATDDDYIPFVGTTLTDDNPPPTERLVGQMHRPPPPPPPVFESLEPEIVLKIPGQSAEDNTVGKESEVARQDNTSSTDIVGETRQNGHRRNAQQPRQRKARFEILDKLLSKKEKAGKTDTRTESLQLMPRRTNKWELPSLNEITAAAPTTKLQQYIAMTPRRDLEPWRVHKAAMERKFGEEGWKPHKRLSPEAIDGIRALHAQHPDEFTTPKLASLFKVSPDVVRRILKSKAQIWNKMIEDGTVKTKSMKKKERRARDKRKKWDSVTDQGPSMSSRIF
ncbi:hypothetical protein BDD12DRAFT_835901 [Trichophaea hybrida]|nr:hypothetical protein BDD12DRAFT_835901 [Trichophaea hybrida]